MSDKLLGNIGIKITDLTSGQKYSQKSNYDLPKQIDCFEFSIPI